MKGVGIFMMTYVVMYKDGSWGNTGDYILGVFDNKKQAQELVAHVKELKDFEELSGSKVYIEMYPMNKACSDEAIDDLD